MRLREQVNYKPEWDGSVIGYAKSYLVRNVWRVTPLYELDDLLQEAYLLFMQLEVRYEYENPKHFMAMWKRCIHNWFKNLSNQRTRRREESLPDDLPSREDRDIEDWEQEKREAPWSVRRLITSVESRKVKPRRRKPRGARETTNTYLCRIAGVDKSVPLRRIFERWLGAETEDN